MALLIQAFAYISSIGTAFKLLGVTKHEAGNCIITSIGSLGIEDGYPPIPAPTFVPMLVSICKKETVYEYDKDKTLQEKLILGLNFSVDCRFVDAKSAKGFIADLKRLGENPDEFESEMKAAERE